jgi:hypothetical protein
MATRRYRLSVGDNIDQVVEEVGAAVSSESIELTVDLGDAKISSQEGKMRVLNALEIFEAYITKGNWPPA